MSCQTAGTSPTDTNLLYRQVCVDRDLGRHVLKHAKGRAMLERIALNNRTFNHRCDR